MKRKRSRAPSGRLKAAYQANRAARIFEAACAHHRRGALLEAEEAYRQTIALQSDHAIALFNLGLLTRQKGQVQQALDLLGRAAAHAPKDGDVVGAYGGALAEAERWGDALEWLERAEQLAPNDSVVRFNLAQAYQRLQRPDRAVILLRLLVQEVPDDPEIWTVLGAALNDLGRTSDGTDALRRALALDPGAADARNELGNIYIESGRFEDGAREFRLALERKPTLTGAIWNLTRTRRYTSADRQEIDTFAEALVNADLAPRKRADVQFSLGKVCEDCEDYPEAIVHYEKANALLAEECGFDAASREQEVDRVIADCTLARLASFEALGSMSEQPVFIVGMPRSGTSLVEQVVSSHSRASGAGELFDLPRLVSELGKRFGTEYPGFLTMLTESDAADSAASYLHALRTQAEFSSIRITDKLPGNFNFLALICALFPRSRVIHCRRNAMDVGLSLYTRPFSGGHEYSYRLSDIAAEIMAYQRLMAHWSVVCPLSMYEIQYEALIENPEPEMRALIEFCGLDWEPECLDFHRTERRVRTASQWQVRQPIYGTSVERWRRFGRLGDELEQQLGAFPG